MKCAWDAFLQILPVRYRREVDMLGKEQLNELRLRIGQPAEMISHNQSRMLSIVTMREDIQFVINAASRYSPWAATTISKGYLTACGGHRIGICGECVVHEGTLTGVKNVSSLCIRIAREFLGIGEMAPQNGSLLIVGPPGAGKTTLLRDIIRIRSSNGAAVVVVDERGEIFPSISLFDRGVRTDVLTGCAKPQGIDMALRTMGPRCIAVDEITAAEDCQALLNAGWCGVQLLATAHADSLSDLVSRPIYQPLVSSGIFGQALVLRYDKSWQLERMVSCF